jgi:DNA repair protein RecN (Recombination protein N)
MLVELHVKNFALIEDVRLSLEPGLNVLTGETGAGKSILLDSLSLILGGRASSDWVRKGTDKATIEALFAVELSPALQELCDEYGLEIEEEEHVLITRELSAGGKNVCRVNGRLVTVQMLRQIGKHLMNMHGQHEHQTLAEAREQLAMLDAYGGEELLALRREVAALYQTYREAKVRLQEAQVGEQERVRKLDILRFQLEEIREANLRPGEDEALEEERRRLAYSEKLFAVAEGSYARLYTGDVRGGSSTLDQLNLTISELEGALRYDEGLGEVLELLRTALYSVEEAARSLRAYRDEIEFNPLRLEQIEERLSVLRRLRKKYGDSIEEILELAEHLQTEYEQLEHYEENLERLQREVERAGAALAKKALLLSKKRRVVGEELALAVTDELTELMMPNVQFAVSFSEIQEQDGLPIGERRVHVSESGIDRVEFLFSPNPGEPLRPLAKIASGGELSRTMLAIKTILADIDDVGTLIFDEVDTGISGRAAQAVAEKLAMIGQKRQVLCVTHLAQVASMADTHYLIEKHQSEHSTRTQVYPLDEPKRVEELARMLSGHELTETTLAHAEEMLGLARVFKGENGSKRGTDGRCFTG